MSQHTDAQKKVSLVTIKPYFILSISLANLHIIFKIRQSCKQWDSEKRKNLIFKWSVFWEQILDHFIYYYLISLYKRWSRLMELFENQMVKISGLRMVGFRIPTILNYSLVNSDHLKAGRIRDSNGYHFTGPGTEWSRIEYEH